MARNQRGVASDRHEPLQMSDERSSRAMADEERHDDAMELSAAERDQMLRDDALQNMLPTPPAKPGIHYFYASMLTQGGASITWYRKLGYRPVRYEEMPGWATATMKSASGEYAGCITVNEMLLMQCNDADYKRYMRILHHDKPNEEAGRVKDMLDAMKNDVGEKNILSVADSPANDGFAEMERQTKFRRPIDFE